MEDNARTLAAQRKPVGLFIVATFGIGIVAVLLFWLVWIPHQKQKQLETTVIINAYTTADKLFFWGVDDKRETLRGEVYPETLSDLTYSPEEDPPYDAPRTNPYSGKPIRELQPGEANSLGDVRYIPMRSFYRLSDGTTHVENFSYILCSYVSNAKSQKPQLNGRLGNTKISVLLADSNCKRILKPRVFSAKMKNIQSMVVDIDYETPDEALTRLGYP